MNEAEPGFNRQFNPEVGAARDAARKDKTDQMKQMLDKQLALHQQEKEKQAKEDAAVAKKVQSDFAEYEAEMNAKRKDQHAKNMANMRDVKKQIAERGGTLRSVGSQVIIQNK